jgi:hypothetical protein
LSKTLLVLMATSCFRTILCWVINSIVAWISKSVVRVLVTVWVRF